MKDDVQPSNDGLRLVKEWYRFQREAEQVKSHLNSIECAMSNAKDALVKWLVPDDAKNGNTFILPVGDAFLEVRVVEEVGGRSFPVDGSDGEDRIELVKRVSWRGNRRPKDWR